VTLWYPTYSLALEAAGAVVELMHETGGYQGTAWFRVKLPSGARGWIAIDYGSCSGCDDLEANAGELSKSLAGLAEFGRGYFDGLLDQAAAEKKAAEYGEFDEASREAAKYVREHAL